MTLEQAEQKILAHVLSNPEGWKATCKDFIGCATYTYMRNDALKVVAVRENSEFGITVNVKTGEENPATLLTSDKYPDLIEWWDRAEKASAEKRVIDFAETL